MSSSTTPAAPRCTGPCTRRSPTTTRDHNANLGGPFATSRRLGRRCSPTPARQAADFLGAARRRDRVRRQHDHAHDARLADALPRARPRRRGAGDGPRPRRQRRAVAAGRRGSRRHRAPGRDRPGRVRDRPERCSPAMLTDRTRVAAFGWASNGAGTVNDVAAMCALCREAGALSYVDAVHYAPARADRRRRGRVRLPRVLGVQVLRPARRHPVRAGGAARAPPPLQGAAGAGRAAALLGDGHRQPGGDRGHRGRDRATCETLGMDAIAAYERGARRAAAGGPGRDRRGHRVRHARPRPARSDRRVQRRRARARPRSRPRSPSATSSSGTATTTRSS